MNEEMEFSSEELDNLYGGMHKDAINDKVAESPQLYRQSKIEELKQEKERLEQIINQQHNKGKTR